MGKALCIRRLIRHWQWCIWSWDWLIISGLGWRGRLNGGHGNIGNHGIIGQHGGGYGYNGGYDEKQDPFYFKYGVHDDKYYTDFTEERSGDEAGNIKGEYTVALPDGRVQDVVYH